MRINKNFFIIVSLAILTMFSLGCSLGLKRGPVEGGVYRSDDSAKTWQQKVFVAQDKKQVTTIANVDIKNLQFSPVNGDLLVAVGGDKGLLVTTDAGEHWQQVYKAPVSAVALHTKAAGTIFLAAGNRIFQSLDAGQNWQNIYLDSAADSQINDLAVSRFDDRELYAATSRGILLQSLDAGASWQQVYIFKGGISKVLVSPSDSKLLYVAQADGHLWRSLDKGATWLDLYDLIKTQIGARFGRYRVAIFASGGNNLLLATQYGLFLGSENGQKWQNLKLVTPPNTVSITALAVSPKLNDIYYATASGFYRSTDNGATWQTSGLPSARLPTALVINPNNDKQIYLGFSSK